MDTARASVDCNQQLGDRKELKLSAIRGELRLTFSKRRTMRHRFTGIIRPALALLSLSLVSLAGHAQTASAPTRPAGPFSYDVSQEVALNGTVSVVLAKAAPGMMPGAHLL